MVLNAIVVALFCAVSYALGRLRAQGDDIQHMIDFERLKRESQGLYRVGDEKTERGFFDPVIDRDEVAHQKYLQDKIV